MPKGCRRHAKLLVYISAVWLNLEGGNHFRGFEVAIAMAGSGSGQLPIYARGTLSFRRAVDLDANCQGRFTHKPELLWYMEWWGISTLA